MRKSPIPGVGMRERSISGRRSLQSRKTAAMRFRQQQQHDDHQPEGGGAADREQQIEGHSAHRHRFGERCRFTTFSYHAVTTGWPGRQGLVLCDFVSRCETIGRAGLQTSSALSGRARPLPGWLFKVDCAVVLSLHVVGSVPGKHRWDCTRPNSWLSPVLSLLASSIPCIHAVEGP